MTRTVFTPDPPPLPTRHAAQAKYNNSKTPAPKFDIPTDLAVSVLSAAAYLDC